MHKLSKQCALNRAQVDRLNTYLQILEKSLPKTDFLPLKASQRTIQRIEKRHRNFKKAIELVRVLSSTDLTVKKVNFKNTMQYNPKNETLQLHSQSGKHKICKISESQQLKAV